jgi:hypothetical protein
VSSLGLSGNLADSKPVTHNSLGAESQVIRIEVYDTEDQVESALTNQVNMLNHIGTVRVSIDEVISNRLDGEMHFVKTRKLRSPKSTENKNRFTSPENTKLDIQSAISSNLTRNTVD